MDLGYAIGDALILAMSISIFGLSWRYLGGRFRRPIITILAAFGLMYVADFFFSYYTGTEEYFNGHWVDFAFLIVMTLFGVALVYMDPKKRLSNVPSGRITNAGTVAPIMSESPVEDEPQSPPVVTPPSP